MSFSEPVREIEGDLDHPENAQIIQFLKQHQPSAYTDIVQLLVESAEDLPDVKFYCPDTDNHASYLAHTPEGIIFAAAMGMSALMYRLPKQSMSAALMKGGEVFPEIGEPWVSFNPYWPEKDKNDKLNMDDMKQWSNLASHYAMSGN